MAFRLRPTESSSDGLRRLARKELRSAREELSRTRPPHDEAIYEARKSVKKVRAIRRLIDADDGRGIRGDGKALRKVNRRLSKLRDADAMLEILRKLKDHDPHALNEHTYARLHRRLTAHKRTAMRGAWHAGMWRKVDRDLRRLRKRVKGWRPAHRLFPALAKGIHATLRDGRKAMARANERQRAADFHEWRKHIKALWYELRLLEGSSPAVSQDIAALHRAETSLGDDHNIVVLFEELSKDPPSGLAGLRRSALRHQAELRRRAAMETQRIYGTSSRQYVRRLERAWKAWRRSAARASGVPQQAA